MIEKSRFVSDAGEIKWTKNPITIKTILDSGEMRWELGRTGEYICSCGVGHGGDHLKTVNFVRGCCGCCSRADYPGKKLKLD